ncbi:MAG: hypothetical protein ACT4NY_05685 [Pseudonocardiales bacterium]
MPTVDQTRHGGTPCPTTLTSTTDGRDHLVSAHAMTSGLVAGHGDYLALCGRVLVAAPMVAPPGQTCFDCETARHRITISNIGRRPRRGLVARLLRWRRQPAHTRSGAAGQAPAATDR